MTKLDRRELIKKSVVAGGVVWTAPTLLTRPAWAQTNNCNTCSGGIYYLKIPSQNPVNCGENGSCGTRARYNGHQCGECLAAIQAIQFSPTEFFSNGKVRKARITIDARLRLIEAETKFSSTCQRLLCETYPTVGNETTGPYVKQVQARIAPNPPTTAGQPQIIESHGGESPINELALVLCFEGGTTFPGC